MHKKQPFVCIGRAGSGEAGERFEKEMERVEAKVGYKQTEIGLIPKDWAACRIGDYALKVGSGITPTGGANRYMRDGRPFVRSQNVGWGKLLLDDLVFIDDETHDSFHATEIEKDDVLLNITGASIGRSAVAKDELIGGNVNQHVCIIRLPPYQLSAGFVSTCLLSDLGQRQIDNFQAGGNRQGLNFEQVRSIHIPIPPSLAEQQAIAQTLGDADALIELLERLIAKKRDIKQGAMQELLTGKRRLPGFSGKWVERQLAQIAVITMGQSPASRYYNEDGNGLPLIQGAADVVDRKTIRRVYTTKITKRAYKGDIIMSVRAPVGEIAKTSFDVCLGRGVCAIKCNNNFLYYALIHKEPAWSTLSKGSTFDSVTSADVKTFEILVPGDPQEQSAIAVILSDMDAELTALTAKLAKARQIKQGMMQNLLTGKVRLV